MSRLSEKTERHTPVLRSPVMEMVWLGVGFLIGMSLWLPFNIGARMDARLAVLEGRIT